MKDGPWLITFENFISNDEADRLIELGGVEGYKRSTDVGALKPDGSYTGKVDECICTSMLEINARCGSLCLLLQ